METIGSMEICSFASWRCCYDATKPQSSGVIGLHSSCAGGRNPPLPHQATTNHNKHGARRPRTQTHRRTPTHRRKKTKTLLFHPPLRCRAAAQSCSQPPRRGSETPAQLDHWTIFRLGLLPFSSSSCAMKQGSTFFE